MPRTCTACSHPHRDDIDRLLLEGTPLRNIAKRFSLSAAGLFRHNQHLSTTLANSHKEAELLRADGLLEHLKHLTADATRLKEKAEKAKELPARHGLKAMIDSTYQRSSTNCTR